MEKIGINKANGVLSWITAIFLIIGIISFIWLLSTIFGSIDFSTLTNVEQLEIELIEMEENLLENNELLMEIAISSLLFGLAALVVSGLSLAGLIVSIISIVKCNKYKLNKTSSILAIIGFSIALFFNVTIISVASIVLLIIAGIKSKAVSTISYEKLEKLKILKTEEN